MEIKLTKGQSVSLDKSMKLALVGLGWNTNKYEGSHDFSLDASAFLLGENGKLMRDEDFVFYNNLSGRDGAVVHMGDNFVGDRDLDNEVIYINFTKIPSDVKKITIVVNIYDAEARGQNFGQVSNAYIRIVKCSDEFDVGEPVLRLDLEEEFSIETELVVAEIYEENGEWKFNAVANGYHVGLEAIIRSFGGNV